MSRTRSSPPTTVGFMPGARHALAKNHAAPQALRRIEELPPADQLAVLTLIRAMLDTRRRSTPAAPARAKRKAS